MWGKKFEISDTLFKDLRKEIPGIPTFDEVVDHFGKKLHLFIELKEADYSKSDIYNKNLLQSLGKLSPGENFHFLALSMEPILKLKVFDTKFYLLVAETNYRNLSEKALEYNLGGISGHYLLFTNSILKKHQSQNQKVGTGFCRTKNSLAREVHRGADFIFTNHPWNLI